MNNSSAQYSSAANSNGQAAFIQPMTVPVYASQQQPQYNNFLPYGFPNPKNGYRRRRRTNSGRPYENRKIEELKAEVKKLKKAVPDDDIELQFELLKRKMEKMTRGTIKKEKDSIIEKANYSDLEAELISLKRKVDVMERQKDENAVSSSKSQVSAETELALLKQKVDQMQRGKDAKPFDTKPPTMVCQTHTNQSVSHEMNQIENGNNESIQLMTKMIEMVGSVQRSISVIVQEQQPEPILIPESEHINIPAVTASPDAAEMLTKVFDKVKSLDKKFDEMTTDAPQSPPKPWYKRWFF